MQERTKLHGDLKSGGLDDKFHRVFKIYYIDKYNTQTPQRNAIPIYTNPQHITKDETKTNIRENKNDAKKNNRRAKWNIGKGGCEGEWRGLQNT